MALRITSQGGSIDVGAYDSEVGAPWNSRVSRSGVVLLVVFVAVCRYALFWVASAITGGGLPWVGGP